RESVGWVRREAPYPTIRIATNSAGGLRAFGANPPYASVLDPRLASIDHRINRETTMPLVENKTKLRLKNNELALGFGVHHLRTAATAMLAAAADHDWL